MRRRIAVVVVTWNGADLLPRCLDAALAQQVDADVELWVVDNDSSDGTADLVRRDYPSARLVETGANLGFAGGVNAALRRLDAGLVALLNNDAVPEPDWLAHLLAELDAHPEAAVVTAKVLLTGGAGLNSAGGWVDRLGHGRDLGWLEPDDGRFDTAREVFYAPGTACLLRLDALRQVGLLDERFFLYYEDVDLSWRLRLAGWTARVAPAAMVHHEHSASVGSGSSLHLRHDARNRLLMMVKLAPARPALEAALRLPVTAAGFASRGDLRRAALVLRGWLSFLSMLPGALAARRAVRASSTVDRAAVERDRARLEPRP